jgi:hypothetical protein
MERILTMVISAIPDYYTSSALADRLYQEMCNLGPLVDHTCDSNTACIYGVQMNKYYVRAIDYARRISLGDFSGRNARYNRQSILKVDRIGAGKDTQYIIRPA